MTNTTTAPVSVAARPSVSDLFGTWWACLTPARQEWRLVSDLDRAGVGSYLPIITRKKEYPCGKVQAESRVLFPGYVFVRGDSEARYRAAKSRATLSIVQVVNQDKLTRDLLDVERAIETGMKLDPYPDMKVGSRCRVIRGPMQGTKGVLILRPDGGKDFVLVISTLGQAFTMDVPPDMLEPLN